MIHYNLLKFKPGADIMMSMRIDSPDQLSAYLTHPKHAALAQGMKHEIEARMSFDAQD